MTNYWYEELAHERKGSQHLMEVLASTRREVDVWKQAYHRERDMIQHELVEATVPNLDWLTQQIDAWAAPYGGDEYICATMLAQHLRNNWLQYMVAVAAIAKTT